MVVVVMVPLLFCCSSFSMVIPGSCCLPGEFSISLLGKMVPHVWFLYSNVVVVFVKVLLQSGNHLSVCDLSITVGVIFRKLSINLSLVHALCLTSKFSLGNFAILVSVLLADDPGGHFL